MNLPFKEAGFNLDTIKLDPTPILVGSVNTQSVVKPKKAHNGIDGFIFDIEDETQITLSNDITDHYVEDNSTIQDHAAERPVVVTVKGYQGELVNKLTQDNKPFTSLQSKLVKVNQFLPPNTKASAVITNAINNTYFLPKLANNIIAKAKGTFSSLSGLNAAYNRQAEAVQFFEKLRKKRELFTVQTPYHFYDDMLVDSITIIQKGDNYMVSDFAVTFKQIRFASTGLVDFDLDQFSDRLKEQKEGLKEKGKVQGVEEHASVAFKMLRSASKLGEFNIPGITQ